jgi:hypothetical protein
MADEIRNGESKVRVVRLLGHRDDAGACKFATSLSAVSSSFSGSSSRPKRIAAASWACQTLSS